MRLGQSSRHFSISRALNSELTDNNERVGSRVRLRGAHLSPVTLGLRFSFVSYRTGMIRHLPDWRVEGLSKIIHTRPSKQCLAHSRGSGNTSCSDPFSPCCSSPNFSTQHGFHFLFQCFWNLLCPGPAFHSQINLQTSLLFGPFA